MSPTSVVARVALRAPSYTVNPYRKTAVPTRGQLHLMNRLGCGYSRSTWGQMRRAGGATAWFEQQLRPGGVAESRLAQAVDEWFPQRTQSAPERWQNHVTERHEAWEYARDLASYSMLKRIYSNRQVLETMVSFWSDHFHVPTTGDLCWVFRDSYDQMLRTNALGRFDQLLEAVTTHPAMVVYLDNYLSVRNAPNENHGRELLELHTVGRSSGYTEEMVKDSARILSGYTVDARDTWRVYYDAARHTTGAVTVLGFQAANGASDGRAVARDYLRYLAHHPATARTVARKLAVRFVSDQPSAELVDHLAGVFRRSGTDIKSTLRALVAHPEFQASAWDKVRTPVDDLVHTARVLGVTVRQPRSTKSFATQMGWAAGGDLLFSWPRPDGAPQHNGAWTSTSRMLSSFRMHWNLAGAWWPKEDVTYRSPRSWMPERRIRFDEYVDHLCRLVHGRGSTPTLLKAAVQSTGYRPGETITLDHSLATDAWRFVRLMVVLLDTPIHMSR